ncbi:MAG: MgtC/SapB family protein [Gemmatimonas sp.]|uniref:MgtC/SapB family protein n=1 Tax=Gemmatimonas sp. TaxID=1962908 RepID=UPI0025BE1CEE|nr:MgtC/SapB family protein [Gemmatimonas sp.]MCA2986226.1 MgtC/SapB family protein [Gemmatimonas sp.]
MLDLSVAFDLLVAALVGLAVGVQREWTGHTDGPDGRFAGARTFALLGTIGGFAGWLVRLGYPALATVIASGGVLLPIVAYWATMRRPGTTTDGTTEVAAVLVVALGLTAGLGMRTPAAAVGVITVVLLAEKTRLQQTLQRVDATEMRAALLFAVLALVVLPVLPDGGYGPYQAFRPRQLWTVVLIFSALNFAGYITRRLIGETRGLAVTGLVGGFVSSTAVALNFSRRSREEPALALPLALGVVAACTVLIPRLLVVTTMLRPPLALALLPVLGPVLLAGLLLIGFVLWRERDTRPAGTPSAERPAAGPRSANGLGQNPLGLTSSLQMAVAFQLVLFALAWIQQHAGDTGLLASATVLGLTDMDALTLSMTRYAASPDAVPMAAVAVGVGVLSNTALKCGLVLAIGEPRYRRHAAGGLAMLAVGSAAGLALGWPR